MKIQRYNAIEDKLVDLTQEYFDGVLEASKLAAHKLLMIKEITNLHVIRDKSRIDELFKIICSQ